MWNCRSTRHWMVKSHLKSTEAKGIYPEYFQQCVKDGQQQDLLNSCQLTGWFEWFPNFCLDWSQWRKCHFLKADVCRALTVSMDVNCSMLAMSLSQGPPFTTVQARAAEGAFHWGFCPWNLGASAVHGLDAAAQPWAKILSVGTKTRCSWREL